MNSVVKRILICPQCGQAHSVEVQKKNYDRKGDMTCKKCYCIFQFSITKNTEIGNPYIVEEGVVNSLSDLGIKNNIVEKENSNPQILIRNYQNFLDFLEKLTYEQDKFAQINKTLDDLCAQEKKIRDAEGAFVRYGGPIILILSVVFSIMILGILGGLFFGIIVGILLNMLIFKIDKKKHGEERAQEANKFHNTYVVIQQMKLEQQKIVIDSFWNSDIMSLYEKMIPEEYRNIDALEFFIHALEIKRADSEGAVFNLYEEELHRRNMEEMQQQQLDNSEKIMQTQKEQLNMQRQQGDIAKEQLKEMQQISRKQRKISRQVRYGNIINTIKK